MSDMLFRTERAVTAVERAAIFAAFIGLVIMLFLQVIFRFVLESPLSFTEELSRVFIIWLVFVSAANAITRAEHFVVDFVVNFFPRRLANPLACGVDAICLLFMIIAAWISYKTAFAGARQTLPALQVSIIVQTLAMPVGFTLMTFHALVLLVRRRHIGDPAAARVPDPEDQVETGGGA